VRSEFYLKIKNYVFQRFPRIVLYPTLNAIDKLNIKLVFRSQSNEFQIIENLLKLNSDQLEIEFLEFGFDPTEFNCARISQSGHKGTLIDLDSKKVTVAQKVLNKKTRIINGKIEIESLKTFKVKNKFYIVSIDVDGNDYEFAREAFLHLVPAILICEYNAIYQEKRVKVPYDKNFDRRNYHGNYYGCSLTSLVDLAHSFGYCLAGVSSSAVNAFFIPSRFASRETCAENLDYGINQNKLGTVSRQGKRELSQMLQEIKSFSLDDLGKLAIRCSAN
jgi:hypothetical protein